jgi:hypothetical protein
MAAPLVMVVGLPSRRCGMCDDFIDDGGDDFWDGLEWQDWMIIGPMSEEIARQKREQRRLEREISQDDEFDSDEEF